MSDTDGNYFKTLYFPLMFNCIFMLFTVKDQPLKWTDKRLPLDCTRN